MGRFIVSRSDRGDRFLIQSESGMTLAASRDYATLDACKKGIRSLILYLPLSPVVDRTAGESAPNPKCEIVSAGEGYAYLIKSPNGKTVLTSSPMQSKKALLRAISMLKSSVCAAEVLFLRQGGYVPLKIKQEETPVSENAGKAFRPARSPGSVPEKTPRNICGTPVCSAPVPETEDVSACSPEILPETEAHVLAAPLAESTDPPDARAVPESPAKSKIFGRIKKLF